MFVPVSCTNCGKPFQVPEAALGKLVPCPWCQSTVTALPASAPPSELPAPAPLAPAQEPLTLDDEPPQPVTKKPHRPVARVIIPNTRPARSWFTLATGLVAALVVVVVMALTLLYRGYGAGRVSDGGWTESTAPDGSFGVALPGDPAEEDVPANPAGSVGDGKRYVVRGRYSKTAVWVAYADLSPALVPKLIADKDRVITAGVLRVERDRELSRLKGTVTKEAEVRVGAAWGVELQMDTLNGNVVEWLILVGNGPRPRVYAYGVEGKNVTPTTAASAKLFKTFRVTE